MLEERTGHARCRVEHPEWAGGEGGVELLFYLGDDQYALEHTRVEAFERQIQYDAAYAQVIAPALARLDGRLPELGVYNLFFPLDTRLDGNAEQLDALQNALADWVLHTALALHEAQPERRPRDEQPHGITETRTGRPEGFPYDVTLSRSLHWTDSGVHDGALIPARTARQNVEDLRRARIQKAIDDKRDKLLYRKHRGAIAVLILESDDIALTNDGLVGNQISDLLPECPDWLDELYFVDTTTNSWTIWTWCWARDWWEDGFMDFNPACLDDVCAV